MPMTTRPYQAAEERKHLPQEVRVRNKELTSSHQPGFCRGQQEVSIIRGVDPGLDCEPVAGTHIQRVRRRHSQAPHAAIETEGLANLPRGVSAIEYAVVDPQRILSIAVS